jgi:hypothetical protein
MLVRIRGRPYAVPEEQIDQAALSAMTQAMSWTATPRLTTDPAAAGIPSMVVVMTFNGSIVDADLQCAGGSEGGEPQPQGAVQVAASFCGSGSLISNTSGRIDTSSGVGDPLFAELIRQVADDLFPQSEHPMTPGFSIGGGMGGFGIGGGRSSIGIGGGGIGIGIGF